MNEIEQILKKNLAKPERFIESVEQDIGKLETQSCKAVLEAMRVPKRLLRDLENLQGNRAIQKTKAWHESKSSPWALMLSGDPDTGKSFAAAYWLSRIAKDAYAHVTNTLDQGWKCWYQANDLTHLDRAEYKKLWTHPFLVIDDLGAEYHSDKGYFNTVLYSIISHRYDDLLPTVITSNLGGKEFVSRYKDDRLLRRIKPPHAEGIWLTNQKQAQPELKAVAGGCF